MGRRTKFAEDFVEYLTSTAEYSEHIILSGKWGSGKTYTIKKMIEELTSKKNTDVIYFNSWRYDYHAYSQFALVESIMDDYCTIDGTDTRKFNFLENKENYVQEKKLIKLGKLIDKFFSMSGFPVEITDCFEVGNMNKSAVNNAYLKIIEENVYATALNFLIEKHFNSENLIIFIDELDRVKPNFCINILEFLHHLEITGKNIKIVYATDLHALSSLIDHYYGFGESSIEYIEKLSSSIFNLPELDSSDYGLFLDDQNDEGLIDFDSCFGCFSNKALISLCHDKKISYRTLKIVIKDILSNKDLKEKFDEKLAFTLKEKLNNIMKSVNPNTIYYPISMDSYQNIIDIMKFLQITDCRYKLSLKSEEIREQLVYDVLKIEKLMWGIDHIKIQDTGQLLINKTIYTEKPDYYINREILQRQDIDEEEKALISTTSVLIKIILESKQFHDEFR